MTSRVCRETGVQITRTVTMNRGEAGWTIDHCLTNGSAAEVESGAWDVSMVLRTGKCSLPRSPNSAYPGGVKTDAQEDQSVVLRNSVVAQLGALAVIDCHGGKRFKYGVDAHEGWMLGVLDVAGLGLVGYCASRCPSFRATVCAWCRRLGLQLGSLPLLRNGNPRSTCAFATRWAL